MVKPGVRSDASKVIVGVQYSSPYYTIAIDQRRLSPNLIAELDIWEDLSFFSTLPSFS